MQEMRVSSILPGTGRRTIQHRRMVEGNARLGFGDDVRQHRLEIFQHIAGRDPQHRKAIFFKPLVSQEIVRRPVAKVVRYPIHFDREPRLRTVKIEHVPADGVLPPKPEPAGSLPQLPPQQHFRQTYRSAEFPRVRDCSSWPRKHRQLPSTTASRRTPSPSRGGFEVTL